MLFPESNSDEDYVQYFNNEIKSNYYLVLKDGEPCATIGWYEVDSENAFVGWFGVLPQYKIAKTNNFVIYTKCFNGNCEKWNNRPLNEDDNYNM